MPTFRSPRLAKPVERLAWFVAWLLACSPVAGASWTRIDTEHFTIFSGAGRAAGLTLASDMERLHSVLANLAGGNAQSPLPTFVYLFADDEALQPFKPGMVDGRRGSGRAVAGGFFAQRELANYMAVNLRSGRGAKETLQHEYTHYFIETNLPPVPLWFNEGLAEYYSTFAVEDGSATIGRPVARHMQRLSRDGRFFLSPTELEALESTRQGRHLYDDAHGAALVYAQGWAVVHYLLSDDLLADRTLEWMRRLDAGEPAAEGFETAFGRPLSRLSDDLVGYFRAADFPLFSASVSTPSTPRMEPLSAALEAAALGDLAQAVNRRQLAERLFVRASELAESSDAESRALGGRARLALASQDFESAERFASDAVAQAKLASSRWQLAIAHHIHGQAQQALTRSSGSDPTSRSSRIEQARTSFRRAIELEPSMVAARRALATTWLLDAAGSAAAPVQELREPIRNAREALRLMPKRPDLAMLLALLHVVAADLDDAAVVLERERPIYRTEDSWQNAWQRVLDLEGALMRRLLYRDGQEPLVRSDLDLLETRLARLERVHSQAPVLNDLYEDLAEFSNRLAVERLWERWSAARQLLETGEATRGRHELKALLREIDWLDDPSIERVAELERATRHALAVAQQVP